MEYDHNPRDTLKKNTQVENKKKAMMFFTSKYMLQVLLNLLNVGHILFIWLNVVFGHVCFQMSLLGIMNGSNFMFHAVLERFDS